MDTPRKGLLSHFTTDRPVAILMVFIAAVVFGWFSYQRLPVNLMPELTYPTLTIRTEYPGAAPEEVENDVSRPIEEALGVIGGLNRISSVSRAGISDVVLEFLWGTDMAEAMQNTLEKLDLVFLPDEAERPLILHYDPALDPVMELSFSGPDDRFRGAAGLRRLRRIAELQIKRQLEPIKGVAAVRIRGGLEEEIHVLLEEKKLLRSSLAVQDVINRLKQENINVAGGSILEGRAEYMVRTLNEFTDLEQISETVVHRIEGREIRVRDLGRVQRSHKEREIVTRTDGDESVQIDIYKEADANMVEVARNVTTAISGEEIKVGWMGAPPPGRGKGPRGNAGVAPGRQQRDESLAKRLDREEGARLKIVADRSIFIKSSIDEVRSTAMFGGLLAIGVLYLFLRNVKSTLIIGVSIPMSILITFAPMNLLSVSLNIMSLGGLAMGIGMLVDNSIVVLESIHRCREEGDEIVPAAVRGTAEVRGAVFASTLTSIAVFFPMVFVEGIAGQAFGDLGMAVVVSLLASLLVALFFIPMLASRRPPDWNTGEAGRTALGGFASWAEFRKQLQLEPAALRFALLPWFVLRFAANFLLELIGRLLLLVFTGIAAVFLRGIVPALARIGKVAVWLPLQLMNRLLRSLRWLYPRTIGWSLRHPLPVLAIAGACFWLTWETGRQIETELLPEVHQGEFTFEVDLPVGTPLEETERILSPVEDIILAEKQDIKSLLVTYGFDIKNIKRSDEGEHTARFKIILEPGPDPAGTEDRVMARLRKHFVRIPDVNVRVVRPVLFSSHTPIVVEVHGDDLVRLKRTADQVLERMRDLPEVTDAETTLQSGAPEVQIVYDRDQIMRFGLNINQVATQVRDMVKGFEATRFNMRDRRIPILVRLEEADRERVADIGRLTINPTGDKPIPLHAIAELQIGEGPSEVRRVGGRRVALVEANIGLGSLGGAVTRIDQTLREGIDWPEGMTFFITGQNEEWERSRGSLFLALALSLFLVYVIMAAQFESLLQPFVIMFTVPLAFFGTMLGLELLGINLSIVVVLGMIMLAGIVVNNAIVLVDYTNLLRARGLSLQDAIKQAGEVRLRPILITTSTTVLGLLPMAMGLGDGAEIRTPMAVAVISGLITSTLLTLLIIPTLFYLLERAKEVLFRPAKDVSG